MELVPHNLTVNNHRPEELNKNFVRKPLPVQPTFGGVGPLEGLLEQPLLRRQVIDRVGHAAPLDVLRPHLRDHVPQPAGVDPAARALLRLQDRVVGEAALREPVGGREARDPRADDHHRRLRLARVDHAVLDGAHLEGVLVLGALLRLAGGLGSLAEDRRDEAGGGRGEWGDRVAGGGLPLGPAAQERCG